MVKEKTENPNIIIAKVTSTHHDFPSALLDIHLTDMKTFKQISSFSLYETEMPNGFIKDNEELTLWVTVNGGYKYIARKNEIIIPRNMEKSVLDQKTQKHFDKFQNKFNTKLDLQKRLAEIQQKIIVINSINNSDFIIKEESRIEEAKKTLVDYLNNKSKVLKTSISRIKI